MRHLVDAVRAQQVRTGVLRSNPLAVAAINADGRDYLCLQQQLVIAILLNEDL